MAKARIHFQIALDGLKEELVGMGDKAQEIMQLAIRCYCKTNPSLCPKVLSLASQMNQCERNVDEITLQLLASKQMTPSDMRQLAACMKISTTLERIGALAVNTADLSLSFIEVKAGLSADIPKIGAVASDALRFALQAFSDADGELAAVTVESTDIVVLIGNEIWINLVATIKSTPELTDQALRALMIARNFEQVATHAQRNAQYVLFWIDGTDPCNGLRTPGVD